MKEYKFRAWDKELNIMCDVAVINFYYGNVVLLARNEEQRKLFQEMNKKALIECDDRLSVSMNEVELMQYTDLNDKNGKEICESDIIVFDDVPYEVYQCESGTWKAGSKIIWEWISDDNVENEWEIIGNVYANPQLLEVV